MSITGVVSDAINTSVAKAARAARRALERMAPGTAGGAGPEPSPRPARKSKGWRRHVRAAKARERGARV